MSTGIYIRTEKYKKNLKEAMNRPEVKKKMVIRDRQRWEKSLAMTGTKIINIHNWLRKIYGKANKCDNKENHILKKECTGKSKRFDWTLKKEYKYERKRENFWMLCGSCHNIYDNKVRFFDKVRANPWNKNLTKYTDERIREYGLKSGKNRKGKGYVPKTAWKKGNISWNKGLTKETDERLKKLREKSRKLNKKYV